MQRRSPPKPYRFQRSKMPESRDRLARSVDIAAVFARRRSEALGILADEPNLNLNTFGSPLGRGTTGMAPFGRPERLGATRGGGHGRGSLGTPRSGNERGRNPYGSPLFSRENSPAGTARRGRGRPTNSLLPSWYPRTPLRDITSVVRAIERRRARLREIEGQEIESSISQDERVLDSSVPVSGAPLEHGISTTSPNPTVGIKHCVPSIGKVPKILLGVTNQTAGDSDFLTPQKKLLNSIDTVEKVVMEELQKLKRTPIAKKAEREKRVRTLMAMR